MRVENLSLGGGRTTGRVREMLFRPHGFALQLLPLWLTDCVIPLVHKMLY